MLFDLTDFQLILNIADTKNLTRAAEKTFLSTPAASNRIKNIEHNLNIKLLERSTQGVEFTEIGQIYLKYARSIYHELDCLKGELQSYSQNIQGKLSIVANTTAVTEYIPTALSDYLIRYPKVQVDLKEKMSEEVVNIISEKSADIGIISGNVDTKKLQTIPLISSLLVLVTPNNHELLKKKSIKLIDVIDHALVTLNEGSAIQTFLTRHAQHLNKKLNIRVQVASHDSVCQMVSAGAGISIIPLSSFKRLKNIYPNLDYREIDEDWANRGFKICAIDFDHLSKFAQDFVISLTKKVQP